MSIPPVPTNFQAYFTQYGIPTGCQWSPFPSPDFDWATVNSPPPLYFGRPLWATDVALTQAAGVAQPGSSSGDGRRFDDIHWPMSSRPDPQWPSTTPIEVVMSGTTAKRQASVDDVNSAGVHRSKRARTPREDIHGAETDTVEGLLQLAPQMLVDLEVPPRNTDIFNYGHDAGTFHMMQPAVEIIPASVAGPSRQPAMAGLDMPIMSQGERRSQAGKASACAESEAHGETANAQAGGETEEKREKRCKPPGDGPWICEVHNREFGRWYELDRHMRNRKHEESAEEFQCERCQDFFSRKDSLQRHQRAEEDADDEGNGFACSDKDAP